MRGAYYITTALLVVASSRTAADYGQPEQLQAYDHDVMADDNVVSLTRPRFLRESGDVHDDLAPTTADNERMDNSALKITENPSAKAILSKAMREISGENISPTETLEAVETELTLRPPRTAAASDEALRSRPKNEWSEISIEEWSDLVNLETSTSNKRAGYAEETDVAGRSDTTRKRHHFLSTADEQNKRRRGPFVTNVSPEDIRSDQHFNPPDDAVGTSHSLLSNDWIELSPEVWAKEINSQRHNLQKIPVQIDKAHAAGQPETLSQHKHLSSTSPEHKAIRDAFIKVGGSRSIPTEEEEAVLRSVMSWKGREDAAISMVRTTFQTEAMIAVARRLVLWYKDKLFRSSWKELSPEQRFNILTQFVNVRYKRLMRVYEDITQEKSVTHAEELTTKDLSSDIGKPSQPSLHHNMGESSDQALSQLFTLEPP